MIRSRIAGVFFCLILGAGAALSQTREAPSASATAPSDESRAALKAIAGEGFLNSRSFEYLTQLSDEVGARVTGTPGEARAVEWAVKTMKGLGLENVHIEKWQMSHGWTRVAATVELLSPIRRALTVDSMGWVGSTPLGGVEADLVPINVFDLENELKNNSPGWAGKVLLMVQKGAPPKESSGFLARIGSLLEAAHRAHAVAIIGAQGDAKAVGVHLTHTGILGFDRFFDIPVVSTTAEDQAQLERFLDAGRPIRLRINVQNQMKQGPIEANNVVGEIRGRQYPNQVFVVGAHLDSWDLAQGTTDNGVGTVCVLSAAEAIARSGRSPLRTIRFVLFTGEEQGSLGSFAYVKQHQEEMVNYLGDLVLDSGQGPARGFNLGGRADLVPAFLKFVQTLAVFGPLKVNDNVEFGTDTGAFIVAGLPGINIVQESPTAEYKFTWHSAADTLEAVKPDVLIHNATLMAIVSYWIADGPERFAAPVPPEKTVQMLIEKHQDGFLKAVGQWPFGEGKPQGTAKPNP